MPDDNDDLDGKDNAFLNPTSMLTPGICGAVVMTATNALGTAFGLHGNHRMLVCLGLSFLIGTVIIFGTLKQAWKKLVFYVFNSLIIFSAATGVNYTGSAMLNSPPPPAKVVPMMLVVPKPSNEHPANTPPLKPPNHFFEFWHE